MQLTRNMTKWQLFSLLTKRGPADVITPDGDLGYLDAIEREDGSGQSFNLTVILRPTRATVFIHVLTTD